MTDSTALYTSSPLPENRKKKEEYFLFKNEKQQLVFLTLVTLKDAGIVIIPLSLE